MDVSIIVPVYNAEPYLRQCIDSLIEQETVYQYEIIAIDDGSTDQSFTILKQYQDQITILTKENSGPSDARNMGCQVATGSYFMFVDSDDYVSPDFVNTMVEAAKKEQAEVVICDFFSVTDKVVPVSKGDYQVYEQGNINEVLRMEFHSCNKLIKRELVLAHPYPSGMFFEDVVSIALALLDAKRIVKLPIALYYYRKVTNSTTNCLAPSNYDILKATDMIAPAFLAHHYEDEIEYLYVNQVLVDLCIKIIRSGKPGAVSEVREIRKRVLSQYPHCFQNKYLKKERLMKRLYLWCLQHKCFVIISLVYRNR